MPSTSGSRARAIAVAWASASGGLYQWNGRVHVRGAVGDQPPRRALDEQRARSVATVEVIDLEAVRERAGQPARDLIDQVAGEPRGDEYGDRAQLAIAGGAAPMRARWDEELAAERVERDRGVDGAAGGDLGVEEIADRAHLGLGGGPGLGSW